MRHHRSAIFTGALALTSFFAIGTGAAGAAAVYGSGNGAVTHPSPAPAVTPVTPVTHVQHVGNSTTLHAATASVNGKSESVLENAKGFPVYYFQGDTAKKSN